MLRRFTPGDRDWFSGELLPTLTSPGTSAERRQPRRRMKSSTREFSSTCEAHPGLGVWMTVERATGERLGFHLLNNIQGETFIQIGFALGKGAWGRGIGTKMAPPCCATARRARPAAHCRDREPAQPRVAARA